jgi:hypothetical protein
MAGARHQVAQAVGRGHGAGGILRGFDRVDVEMVGAGMIGPALDRLLEQPQDLVGPRLRLAALLPVVPRMQVHQRLGQQHLGVGVVRMAGGQLAHRLGVGDVERRAVRRRSLGVAPAERLDVAALRRARLPGQRPRRLQVGPGFGHRLFRHRRVDVRPGHQGRAPEADRARRIEPRRLAERSFGGGMVEAVGKRQPLVEITPRRFVLRGDRVAPAGEARVERRRLHRRGLHRPGGERQQGGEK